MVYVELDRSGDSFSKFILSNDILSYELHNHLHGGFLCRFSGKILKPYQEMNWMKL